MPYFRLADNAIYTVCKRRSWKNYDVGEHTSVITIYSLIPGLVPILHGWGKYKNGSPDTYFFLPDFLDMDTAAPEPAQFTARVAGSIVRASPQMVCSALKLHRAMESHRTP